MTTADQVVALMHQRTRGSLTSCAVLEMRVTMADLLAVLELCGVVGGRTEDAREDPSECNRTIRQDKSIDRW